MIDVSSRVFRQGRYGASIISYTKNKHARKVAADITHICSDYNSIAAVVTIYHEELYRVIRY